MYLFRLKHCFAFSPCRLQSFIYSCLQSWITSFFRGVNRFSLHSPTAWIMKMEIWYVYIIYQGFKQNFIDNASLEGIFHFPYPRGFSSKEHFGCVFLYVNSITWVIFRLLEDNWLTLLLCIPRWIILVCHGVVIKSPNQTHQNLTSTAF